MLLLEFLSEISEIARAGSRVCTPGNKQLQEQAKLGLVCWGGGKVSYTGTNLALGDRSVYFVTFRKNRSCPGPTS